MKTRAHILILAGFAVTALVLGFGAFAFTPGASALLPDGETKPIIVGASVSKPHSGNELLEADLSVEAYDDGTVVSYEYRWNRATLGSVHTTEVEGPTVDFRSTSPSERHVLQVRAVDDHGWRSEWYVAFDGETPSAPNLIIAGDSIASGYERQWFSSKGSCRSPELSYGAVVQTAVAASLPSAWEPDYHNVARAGAGVYSMTNGGEDPCGTKYGSQVDSVANLADPDTWNIVVVTAGINSTNWGEVVGKITQQTAFSFAASSDDKRCLEAVTEWWNLSDRAASIARQTTVVSDALTSTTNAQVYWTSYYSIAGSRLVLAWTPIGDRCADEMAGGLDLLHSTLQSGLGDDVTWIDIDAAEVSLQDWGGWPHPDESGHKAIGTAVASAVG